MRSIVLASVLGLSMAVTPTPTGGQTPVACAVLSEKEALALVGGPLGEISKGEQKPTMENGHDHNTWCGFFPKGYDLRKADRPPERGLMLQLHAMRNPADAKGFYENTVEAMKEMAKASGSPPPVQNSARSAASVRPLPSNWTRSSPSRRPSTRWRKCIFSRVA